MTFFGHFRRKAIAPHAKHAPREVEVARRRCGRCCPTARAIRLVQAKWVVAGIDLGE
jgi:hypothetical protein